MINTSNEYKELIQNDRKFKLSAEILLANSTVLNVSDDDIMINGISFSDATSASSTFQIGGAIIGSCTLTLNNNDDKFSDYDFIDAIIRPRVGLILTETVETINKGIYTVDSAQSVGGTIVLTCLDNMFRFDVPFSEVAISYPTTAAQLLQTICTYCGVPLATYNFLNNNYLIPQIPNSEATTCREIVSYIAQLSGNFARININGALELKWYDFNVFETELNIDGGKFDNTIETNYQSGDNVDGGDFTFTETNNYDGGTFLDMKRYHHFYNMMGSPTIATDDIIITGIQVTVAETENNQSESVLYGSAGYVIDISNPLIQYGTANQISSTVGQKIVGMKFRPISIGILSDPSIEAGDVAKVTDRKNNTYETVITNIYCTVGSSQTISCDAETPSKRASAQFSASTKAIIESRKVVKQEISTYDLAVKQLNDLLSHSFGLYRTEEKLEDGSTIYYMHNKPTLAQSQTIWKQTADAFAVSTNGGQTYSAGFDAYGNAVLNVLSAIGINAEWIKVVSSFSVGNNFRVDSYGNLIARSGQFIGGKITGSEFISETTGKKITIGNGRFQSESGDTLIYIDSLAIGIQRLDNSTVIGSNGINTGYVNCSSLAINGYAALTTQNIANSHTHTKLDGGGKSVQVYSTTFRSNTGNDLMCGSPSYPWTDVYATNTTISTSDATKKNNIAEMTNDQYKFFKMIIPVTFQFIDGQSGRTHYGFTAQQIEQAMEECGLTSLDFAGFIKSPRYEKMLENGEWDTDTEIVGYDYALRYEEFISLNTYAIQRQQKEILLMKDKLSKIEKILENNRLL